MDITKRVADLCEAIEDVTDELTHTAGSVTTKIAPLLATFASGLSVLFAIWDGIGSLLNTEFAYWISFAIGAIVMLGLEGASLASVFNTDRIKALNATRPIDQQLPESSLPGWMLALTMVIVFCTEVAPTFARWVNSTVSTSDLVFAFGLLALPLLGRAGAVIFSNSRTLDGMDGADSKRQSQKDNRRQADLDLEIKRRKAELELEQDKAAHALKLELQREKEQAKMHKSVAKSVVDDVAKDNNTPVQQDERNESATQRRNRLIDLLQQHGDIGDTAFGQQLGVDRTTVYRDFRAMAKAGLVHKNGQGWKVN